ncbi:hypothetical protein [Mycolicibacterium sp. CBMA 234]|uniref:hypothetical protein n=1 Tax=Mycolicibacterium sp. CBMA 234 TaxID=1918495 RepID=UPI0012DE1B42|nr:hypothetical protein [Mycolicibacterium sp. CBMA 234]
MRRRKLGWISDRRTAVHHAAADRAPASRALRARQAFAKTPERLIRLVQPPLFPDVGDDMLIKREPVAHLAARAARTPVLGLALITYLVAAWIVTAVTFPRSVEGPTAVGTGITDETILPIAPGIPPGSGLIHAADSVRPDDVRVDPRYFANLQTVLGNLDGQADHDRPIDQHHGFGQRLPGPAAGSAAPVDGQSPEAPAPATAADLQSGPPVTALPSGQQPDGASSPDPSPSAAAPLPPPAGSPDAQQPAGASSSDAAPPAAPGPAAVGSPDGHPQTP